jgi:8-oxo-dGTP pyrophosphatase MutT (NUDIX family)
MIAYPPSNALAMQALAPETPIVPRPAATVLLLRDSDAGPEVYMLRRHAKSDVLGGVHVFPGGKLDKSDCESECLCRVGSPLEGLHESLGEPELDPSVAAGLFYAACRETFEEARVLLGRPGGTSGSLVQGEESERAWSLLREGVGFGEVLATRDLELASDALVPWSRWITPKVPSMMVGKRFDTRFFVAALPEGQVAGFDDHEAVAGDWFSARQALTRYAAGDIILGPPQIMSLLQLAPCRSVAEVLDAARRRRPPLIEPEPFDLDGVRVVCYPGDERHPCRERALIGPTRLFQRNKRFEPAEGIEALLEMARC